MDRLTAEDRLMLWPDRSWPQENGALVILDAVGLEEVRQAVAARLHRVPRLRQRLAVPPRGLGPPLWVDDAEFDVDAHIQLEPLPPRAGEAQLLAVVERLRRRRLDRARPLWQMWLLPGLPDGRAGLFIKMHHVVGDGLATVAAAGTFLDTAPDPPASDVPQWIPAGPPTNVQLLADNARRLSHRRHPIADLRRLGTGWPAVRELLTVSPAPTSTLNQRVGPGRRLAILRCELDAARSTAHAHDATINDVLLATAAAGLGALLRHRGAAVNNAVIPVYVPVTLRRGGYDRAQGNLIGQMVVPLPVGGGDAGLRLRRIAAETARRKALPRPPLGAVFRSRLVSGALLAVMKRHPVNVTTADLPGPRQPMYLAGARVFEMFPVLPLIATVSLGIGALSYAGRLGIMVVADDEAYPDLEVFLDGAQDELTCLTGR